MGFKLLHTADWHLGQRLLTQDRREEHQRVLDWLIDTITEQKVDALLVAGDIFDIGNPPNYARELYYRFVTRLRQTNCRHVVITGGNHDSPGMLDAPKELLRALNIHVVGAATGNIEDEIIELKNEQGELEAVVAAVPFLRDRDLRQSVAGESGSERLQKVRLAIRQHFHDVAAAMEKYATAQVPLIAMGHLHATGSMASGKQQPIYVGNIENIQGSEFPDLFDYIALGHIHRPQVVGGRHHIRYSGSLLPLDFSEVVDDKSVYTVTFDQRSPQQIAAHPVPIQRRLKRIQGDLEKVKASLQRFADKGERGLRSWVEIVVETDEIIPQLDQELRAYCADMPLDILSIRLDRRYISLTEVLEAAPDLDELTVEDVFEQRCTAAAFGVDQTQQLLTSFRELRQWWKEEQEEERT